MQLGGGHCTSQQFLDPGQRMIHNYPSKSPDPRSMYLVYLIPGVESVQNIVEIFQGGKFSVPDHAFVSWVHVRHA